MSHLSSRPLSCSQFSCYINAVNLYSIGYCWPTLDPGMRILQLNDFLKLLHQYLLVSEPEELKEFIQIRTNELVLGEFNNTIPIANTSLRRYIQTILTIQSKIDRGQL